MSQWALGVLFVLATNALADPKHEPIKVNLEDPRATLPRWGVVRSDGKSDGVRTDPFVRVDGNIRSLPGRKRGLAHNVEQFREACITLAKKPEEWPKRFGPTYPFVGKDADKERKEFEDSIRGRTGAVRARGIEYRSPDEAWKALYFDQLRTDFTSEIRERVALDPPADALKFTTAALLDWLDAYDEPFLNQPLPLRRSSVIYAKRTAELLLPLAKEDASGTALVPLLEKMAKGNLDESELKGLRTGVLTELANQVRSSPFGDGLRSLYRLLDAQSEAVREANEQGRKSAAATESCLLVTAADVEETQLEVELRLFDRLRSSRVSHEPAPAEQYRALLQLCPMLSPKTRRLFLELALGVDPAKAGTLKDDPSESEDKRRASWQLLDRTVSNLRYLYNVERLGNLACRSLEPEMPATRLPSQDGDKRLALPTRPAKHGAEALGGFLDSLKSRIPVPDAQTWDSLERRDAHRTVNAPFVRPFADMNREQERFVAKHNVNQAKSACGFFFKRSSNGWSLSFGLGYLNRKRGGEGVVVEDGNQGKPVLDPVAKKRHDEILAEAERDPRIESPHAYTWRALYFEHLLQDFADAQPPGLWPTGSTATAESIQAMAFADWAEMTLAARQGKKRAAPRMAAQLIAKFKRDFGWNDKLTEAAEAFGKGTLTGKQAELLRWFVMMRYRDGDEPELPYVHYLLDEMRNPPTKESIRSTGVDAKVCEKFDQFANDTFRDAFGKHFTLQTKASVSRKDAAEPLLHELFDACPDISSRRRDELVDLGLDTHVEHLGNPRYSVTGRLHARWEGEFHPPETKKDPSSRKILQGLVWLKAAAEKDPQALAEFCQSLETELGKNPKLVKKALAATPPPPAPPAPKSPTPTPTSTPVPAQLPPADQLGFRDIAATSSQDFPALYEANLKALTANCAKQKRRDDDMGGKPLSENGLDEDERKFLATFVEKTALARAKGTLLEQKQAYERAEATLPFEAAALLDVFGSDPKKPSLHRMARKLLEEELRFEATTPKEYLEALQALVHDGEPTGKNKDQMAVIRKHLLKQTDVNASEDPILARRNAARLLFVFAAEEVTAPPATTEAAKIRRHDWLMGFCFDPYSAAQSKLSQLKRK